MEYKDKMAGSESESEPQPDKGGRDDTFFLPEAMLKGVDVNPGDVLEFKVVGKSPEGEIEVEYNQGEAKDASFADDLHKEMASPTESQPQGGM